MEHLLLWSKCSIFHNIFKYMIFQRRQKALQWSKGLSITHLFITQIWIYHGHVGTAQFFFTMEFYNGIIGKLP